MKMPWSQTPLNPSRVGYEFRPNFRHLSGALYVVRTQAGFNQAFKHRFPQEDEYDPKPSDVQGYPKVYPSVVRFSMQYQGYWQPTATCTPLNIYRQQLKNLLTQLKGE